MSTTSASLAAVRDWLINKVGVGGTFTMLELREAVPDANQVDRRMRELRQMDPPWIIKSAQTDPSLPLNCYRLEAVGGMTRARYPSSKVRRKIFEAAGNRCQVCGIGLGEEYADYPGELARLQLGHWTPLEHGGSSTAASNLRAECHRCNGGIGNQTGAIATPASVEARARNLSRARRAELLRWLEQNRRDVVDEAEVLFYELRQIPAVERERIILALRASVAPGPQ